MRRPSFFFVLAGILGGGWLLLDMAWSPRLEPGQALSGPAGSEAEAGPVGPEAGAGNPVPAEASSPQAVRRPVADPETPSPAFLPQLSDGWVVEVVRRQSPGGKALEPVPGAGICVVGEGRSGELSARRRLQERWAENLLPLDDGHLRLGSCHLADAEGRVRVPPPPELGLHLFGWHGAEWGRLRLERDMAPPFRLVLEPDALLRVQVVDAQGTPGRACRSGLPAATGAPSTTDPPWRRRAPRGWLRSAISRSSSGSGRTG